MTTQINDTERLLIIASMNKLSKEDNPKVIYDELISIANHLKKTYKLNMIGEDIEDDGR